MARDKKPRSAIKDVVSREYTINLHKVHKPKYKFYFLFVTFLGDLRKSRSWP